jgi:ribosome assembly protein YihI (activator of Der GTPase)
MNEDLTSEEGNPEWKGNPKQLNSYPFQEIEKIENGSKLFQNDFEYVDNLFQEVQYLINYKELSKVKEKKEENQNTSQYFDADKISVLSMKNGIQNPF